MRTDILTLEQETLSAVELEETLRAALTDEDGSEDEAANEEDDDLEEDDLEDVEDEGFDDEEDSDEEDLDDEEYVDEDDEAAAEGEADEKEPA